MNVLDNEPKNNFILIEFMILQEISVRLCQLLKQPPKSNLF